MSTPVVPLFPARQVPLDTDSILAALECAVLVVDTDGTLAFLNDAAERFFAGSAAQLCGQSIGTLVPRDSPVLSLIRQAQERATGVSEYGLVLDTPRTRAQLVNIQVSPINDRPGCVAVAIFARNIADKIDRQLNHRNIARSVTAMAAMLAHEVKNPLSGIRGAAQLLESSVEGEDRSLTRLIRDESDRICALVDRMDVFADQRPMDRGPVNIHVVLERVKRLAQNGFAKHVNLVENYDPSLPPVDGNIDQLVQIFLNLVKNAAEAAPAKGGEIVLTTSYQHGVRFAVPGSSALTQLPLVVSVQDNGPGIPESLQIRMFDAFVTTKAKGTGIGLALVAKMVDDHGGIIEFDTQPGRTVFRVMLPMARGEPSEETA
jgi:two-component system, NtrC family, nitrogen regulation sensor histidine kinase GlnL